MVAGTLPVQPHCLFTRRVDLKSYFLRRVNREGPRPSIPRLRPSCLTELSLVLGAGFDGIRRCVPHIAVLDFPIGIFSGGFAWFWSAIDVLESLRQWARQTEWGRGRCERVRLNTPPAELQSIEWRGEPDQATRHQFPSLQNATTSREFPGEPLLGTRNPLDLACEPESTLSPSMEITSVGR